MTLLHRFALRLLPCLVAAGAFAAEPEGPAAQASLLTGWRQTPASHVAAIRIDLGPGWKTYWRAPGDAGIPPHFDWTGSKNLASVTPVWPKPIVFDQDGMRSIGYKGSLVLPLQIETRTPGQDISLHARVDIGLCKDICVPQTLVISATLPAHSKTRDARLVAALAERAYRGRDLGLPQARCQLSPQEDGMTVTAQISVPPRAGSEAIVIETANPALWVSTPKITRQGGQIEARSTLQHVDGAPFALDRSGLRITLLDTSRAIEFVGCTAG